MHSCTNCCNRRNHADTTRKSRQTQQIYQGPVCQDVRHIQIHRIGSLRLRPIAPWGLLKGLIGLWKTKIIYVKGWCVVSLERRMYKFSRRWTHKEKSIGRSRTWISAKNTAQCDAPMRETAEETHKAVWVHGRGMRWRRAQDPGYSNGANFQRHYSGQVRAERARKHRVTGKTGHTTEKTGRVHDRHGRTYRDYLLPDGSVTREPAGPSMSMG